LAYLADPTCREYAFPIPTMDKHHRHRFVC
jgi:hypothetical protein